MKQGIWKLAMTAAASERAEPGKADIRERVAPALLPVKFISLLSNPKTSNIPNQNSRTYHGISLSVSF